jgi:hypothetical protein
MTQISPRIKALGENVDPTKLILTEGQKKRCREIEEKERPKVVTRSPKFVGAWEIEDDKSSFLPKLIVTVLGLLILWYYVY